MKLLILENENITKKLIKNAIGKMEIVMVSFPSINDAFEHVNSDSTPFILISEIINTGEIQVAKLSETVALDHFKGIVFLSKYNDSVIELAKQMGKDIGIKNTFGLGLPAELDQIKKLILRVIALESKSVISRASCNKLDIDEIEMALANDLFEPYFQAQVCSKSEKVEGFEILSRLCIDGQIYTPDTFIEPLISHNKITKFTFIILNKTLDLIKNYPDFDGDLSLNVDYQSLEYFDFAKDILDILEQANFPINKFTIELTENNPTINFFVMHNLAIFRMAECKLSIDDFGTQSSGFTELLKLPFSEIKIDKSFINEMTVSARGYKVVKALCAVAHSLDCNIVAEGVETRVQRTLIRELNVCRIQGYFYSKPQAVHEAMKLFFH